jgi:hypothetical protein
MRLLMALGLGMAAIPASAVNPRLNGQPGSSSYGHAQVRKNVTPSVARCDRLVDEFLQTGSVSKGEEEALAACLTSTQ